MRESNIGAFIKKNDLSAQHFDLFFYSKPAQLEEVSGILVDNHCGLGFIRGQLPEGYHAYGLRNSDDDFLDPATIELHEVMVNFFGYFICTEDLDDMFNGEDYIEIVDYNYAMEQRPMYEVGIPMI